MGKQVERTQVLIIGAGLVGRVLAVRLIGAGVSVRIIDARRIVQDTRTTAISAGGREILTKAGLWKTLAKKVAPIERIDIQDDADPFILSFYRDDVGGTFDGTFGYVVDNHVLRQACGRRLGEALLTGAGLKVLSSGPGGIEARLTDGQVITADLVVGADGGKSTVRQLMGIGVWSWPYPGRALVANLTQREDPCGVALERFTPTGPFALLPAPLPSVAARGGKAGQAFGRALIWTLPTGLAQEFVSPNAPGAPNALESALAAHLPTKGATGGLSVRGTPSIYPLSGQIAKRLTASRVVLIGDAAHRIHPIAGQGFNLALRDVEALANRLIERSALGLDLGYGLAPYARSRWPDIVSMTAFTDGMTRLFGNRLAGVTRARRLGLRLVAQAPFVKRFFIRAARRTTRRTAQQA